MFHEGFFPPPHHLHRFYTGHHLGFLKGYKNRLCILHKQLKRTSASRHVWVEKCKQMNSPYFPVPSFPLKSDGGFFWTGRQKEGVEDESREQ